VSTEGRTDVLGPPYVVETIDLGSDTEGEVVAMLVRRRVRGTSRKAVLHVHGFADYFFHTEYAEWWNKRGYDFYALDLRKHGRSLLEHQTPNYVADVREYFPDLDEAWQRVTERDHHSQVVLSAHSTGGLTMSLWANSRRIEASAMVLNSPWFDLHGPFWLRTIGTTAIRRLGTYSPLRPIPRALNTFYGQSLHRDHGGEWDYDLAWKPLDSWPIYFGWLRAIRDAHAELHRGLDLRFPSLVLTSGATRRPATMSDDVHRHDVVLDVEQIRRWAPALGKHVTVVSVEGARHDVVLSLPDVRAVVYDEIERWVSAYVDRVPTRRALSGSAARPVPPVPRPR